jgi:predicted anti-sigma-YlaC factor YlaD
MKTCPETDTIVTIGAALNWNVAAGLRHLQECADCRARIDALLAARRALAEASPLDEAIVFRIATALQEEARVERTRADTAQRWATALETLLAGIAAPIVLMSSGIEISSVATGVLTFALGAALLLYGRQLRLDAA